MSNSAAEPTTNPTGEGIGLFPMTAYALPVIATTILTIPIVNILPAIYAKEFEIPLTTIAGVLLAANLFDAITDPLIGCYSDYLREKKGTRKSLMTAGSALFLISSYFLYIPPEDAGAAYFLVFLLALFISWTCFDVPHIAWGGELTTSARGKNKIYSLRYAAINIGLVAFFVFPLLPLSSDEGFTLETMKWSLIITAVFMVPALYVCISTVPNGEFQQPQQTSGDKEAGLWFSVIKNPPLIMLLISCIIAGTGVGIWMGVSFLFIDAYLNIGSQAPVVYLIASCLGLAFISVWYKLSNRFGKKVALSGGMFITLVAALSTGVLPPGEYAVIYITVIMSLIYIGSSVLFFIAPSLLSDIVDYSTLIFGRDRGGAYFAIYSFILKANVGLGAAIGLGVAGWYGFDAAATVHAAEHITGLRLAVAGLPALLLAISIGFILNIPMDEHRHQRVRENLALRTAKPLAEHEVTGLSGV